MHGGGKDDPRGKLRAAARAWAVGRGGFSAEAASDDVATQAARAEIERRAARDRSIVATELSLDDVDVINLFIALATQWKHAGLAAVRVGLDYTAVTPTAAMLGIGMTPALFHDVRVMEGAALDAWASKRR